MAGDPFKHVRAGEPLRFSAAVYNHLVDTARRNLNTARPPAAPLTADNRNPSIVRLRNDSGADQARYAVLGINGVLFAPGENGEFFGAPAVSGTLPDADDHAQAFAVLLEPIAEGGTGHAVVDGVVQCQIDVTDAGHGFAAVKTGETRLASAAAGSIKILSKQSGTGIKWALVKLGSAAPAPPGAVIIASAAAEVDFDGARIPVTSVQPDTYEVSDVANVLGLAVAEGAVVLAFYHEATDDWYGFAKPITHTLNPVVDLQVSGLSLQLKTRGIVVLDKDAADSAWTTWHIGTDCPE